MKPYVLSPSDLTFLWVECPRCFYLKVKHKIKRPCTPFPSIFIKIDSLMKKYFKGQSTASLDGSLPSGRVLTFDNQVKSETIRFSSYTQTCVLAGYYDSLLEFENGSYGVVDFKTTEPKEEHVQFYSRQLHAYAYALEHAAEGHLSLSPISRLGLFVVEPFDLKPFDDGHLAYVGKVKWVDIPIDWDGFLGFLKEVMDVLESPTPPLAGQNCGWCKYRQAAQQEFHW